MRTGRGGSWLAALVGAALALPGCPPSDPRPGPEGTDVRIDAAAGKDAHPPGDVPQADGDTTDSDAGDLGPSDPGDPGPGPADDGASDGGDGDGMDGNGMDVDGGDDAVASGEVQDADTTAADETDVEPGDDGVQPPPPGPVVMSLNLHGLKTDGTPYATNEARFEAIAARVAAEGVGVLLLQEVCKQPSADALAMLTAALEEATGETWSSHWVFAHVAWEGTVDECDEGVAVMARGKVTSPVGIVHAVQAGLQRVAVCATLPETLGSLRVCSVHFDHQNAVARRAQAREMANAALVDADPSASVLVGGDFNAKAGSPTHGALGAWGYVDLSQPLDAERIDHVFAHRAAPWRAVPGGAKLVFTGKAEPKVSDHPGVLIRLEPAEPDAVVTTRLSAKASPGAGKYLAIRGDRLPLSWNDGWPARLGSGLWRVIVTEWADGGVEYKFLVDDKTWQSGENSAAAAGDDAVIEPSF